MPSEKCFATRRGNDVKTPRGTFATKRVFLAGVVGATSQWHPAIQAQELAGRIPLGKHVEPAAGSELYFNR